MSSNTFWVPEPLPLTTLLSWTWISFVMEVDNAVEAQATERVGRLFRLSLPMWTNALRCIDEEGVTVDDLQAKTRAAANLGGLERWGWIGVGDVGVTRRDGYGTHRGIKGDTLVRTTRAGNFARRITPLTIEEVEQRWVERFGIAKINELRASLQITLMPWSPPEVSPADGFFTRVVNGTANNNESLSLVALLGQSLTRFTLDGEKELTTSLVISANFLRTIDRGTVRLRDLPELSGLSKEGVAMATGYLERCEFAVDSGERTMTLTPLGLAALDNYRQQSQVVEDERLRAALTAVLDQPDELAKGLIPPDGGWRNEKPYLRQTSRLLADPLHALPWHPMVLHRGGWPDAS